jgi:hypothetical protein
MSKAAAEAVPASFSSEDFTKHKATVFPNQLVRMNILFLSKMFLLKDEVRSLPWVYLRESYLFKVHSKYTLKFLAVLYSSWRALSLSLSPDRESAEYRERECVCAEWRERVWGKCLNNMFQSGACLAEPTKEFGTTLVSSLFTE